MANPQFDYEQMPVGIPFSCNASILVVERNHEPKPSHFIDGILKVDEDSPRKFTFELTKARPKVKVADDYAKDVKKLYNVRNKLLRNSGFYAHIAESNLVEAPEIVSSPSEELEAGAESQPAIEKKVKHVPSLTSLASQVHLMGKGQIGQQHILWRKLQKGSPGLALEFPIATNTSVRQVCASVIGYFFVVMIRDYTQPCDIFLRMENATDRDFALSALRSVILQSHEMLDDVFVSIEEMAEWSKGEYWCVVMLDTEIVCVTKKSPNVSAPVWKHGLMLGDLKGKHSEIKIFLYAKALLSEILLGMVSLPIIDLPTDKESVALYDVQTPRGQLRGPRIRIRSMRSTTEVVPLYISSSLSGLLLESPFSVFHFLDNAAEWEIKREFYGTVVDVYQRHRRIGELMRELIPYAVSLAGNPNSILEDQQNSLFLIVSKVIQRVALPWMQKILGPLLQHHVQAGTSFEIGRDVGPKLYIENVKNIGGLYSEMFEALANAAKENPPEDLSWFCRNLHDNIIMRFQTTEYNVIRNLLVMALFKPAFSRTDLTSGWIEGHPVLPLGIAKALSIINILLSDLCDVKSSEGNYLKKYVATQMTDVTETIRALIVTLCGPNSERSRASLRKAVMKGDFDFSQDPFYHNVNMEGPFRSLPPPPGDSRIDMARIAEIVGGVFHFPKLKMPPRHLGYAVTVSILNEMSVQVTEYLKTKNRAPGSPLINSRRRASGTPYPRSVPGSERVSRSAIRDTIPTKPRGRLRGTSVSFADLDAELDTPSPRESGRARDQKYPTISGSMTLEPVRGSGVDGEDLAAAGTDPTISNADMVLDMGDDEVTSTPSTSNVKGVLRKRAGSLGSNNSSLKKPQGNGTASDVKFTELSELDAHMLAPNVERDSILSAVGYKAFLLFVCADVGIEVEPRLRTYMERHGAPFPGGFGADLGKRLRWVHKIGQMLPIWLTEVEDDLVAIILPAWKSLILCLKTASSDAPLKQVSNTGVTKAGSAVDVTKDEDSAAVGKLQATTSNTSIPENANSDPDMLQERLPAHRFLMAATGLVGPVGLPNLLMVAQDQHTSKGKFEAWTFEASTEGETEAQENGGENGHPAKENSTKTEYGLWRVGGKRSMELLESILMLSHMNAYNVILTTLVVAAYLDCLEPAEKCLSTRSDAASPDLDFLSRAIRMQKYVTEVAYDPALTKACNDFVNALVNAEVSPDMDSPAINKMILDTWETSWKERYSILLD
eukprot:Clim_evm27s243 gene=Clim_evmTU27s243